MDVKNKSTSTLLMRQAQPIPVNHKFDIGEYYDRAERLWRQASIYRVGLDELNLFVILARFSSLLLDTIPKHQSFKSSPESRNRYKNLNAQLCSAITELERLKKVLDEKDKRKSVVPSNRAKQLPKSRVTKPLPATFEDISISSKGSTPVQAQVTTKSPSAKAIGPIDLLSGTPEEIAAAARNGEHDSVQYEEAELSQISSGGKHSFLADSAEALNRNAKEETPSNLVSYPSVSSAPVQVPEVNKITAPPSDTPPDMRVNNVPIHVPTNAPFQGHDPMAMPPQMQNAQASMQQARTVAPPTAEATAPVFNGEYVPQVQVQTPPPPPPPPANRSFSDFQEPQRIDHTPRVVQQVPTAEAAKKDYMNLSDRLKSYGLVEKKVRGDGNCQFRALSDQLFGTPDRHVEVRRMMINQLNKHNDLYEPYVPEDYEKYVKEMSTDGTWGDHVTLQAAADVYGRRICVLSSYKESFIIDIQPQEILHPRVLWLSFWAEVHYNSLYPSGSLEE